VEIRRDQAAEFSRDDSMNLLLINYEYPPVGGGAATATRHIAVELRRLGHAVTVLTSRFVDASRPDEPEALVEEGILLCQVPAARRVRHLAGALTMAAFVVTAALRLRSLLRRREIEGVVVFFTLPCGPLGLLGRKLSGVPYVVSLRGGDVPGLVPEIEWQHRLLQPLRRAVLRHSARIVANSNGLRALSESRDPFPVGVIPNGVDTVFFQPRSTPIKSAGAHFRFLFVGRLQAQQNLPLLLQQIAALRAKGLLVALDIAGDGPLRGALEAMATELGLAAGVEWHGWLGREALRDLYLRADCFVNPSHYEGMPNVALEAMACGLPVIASRVVGNDAVVRDGETGTLYPPGDAQALQSAMAELASAPDLARRLGAAGREWVERDFSWSKVALGYANILATRPPCMQPIG
jgi:glycosyltransferase involved in cell wall biosynthesis